MSTTHAAETAPLPMEARPISSPAIRTIAMPAGTNPAGDIFGGWLMCANGPRCRQPRRATTARGRSATVAVDAMKFLLPVKVGDEVSLSHTLVRSGRTSMQIHVEA